MQLPQQSSAKGAAAPVLRWVTGELQSSWYGGEVVEKGEMKGTDFSVPACNSLIRRDEQM